MMTVVDANLLPIIIAVVIGFIIGWWMFRRNRANSARSVLDRDDRRQPIDAPAEPPPPVRPYMRGRPIRDGIDTVERQGTPNTDEGRGVVDEGAAAIRDISGEVLGVSGHTQHPAEAVADDLQMLKGVGPKLAQKLNENGIFRFDQIAALTPNEVAILDAKMGPFKGRLDRDRVIEQASYLARGDRDGFETRFGRLGSG